MKISLVATALAASLTLVWGQNPGSIPEVHPKLPTWKCRTHGGCKQQDTSVVLNWNSRQFLTSNGTSCTTLTGANPILCPDEETCSANCFVEGANYTAAGVSTSGDSLTLRQYNDGYYVGPSVNLLGNDGDYLMIELLGQELTFTVDLSALPCGENGALFFTQMNQTGWRSPYQTGGANYGSGYCDAQCNIEPFVNGTLNTEGATACCNEIDILEANSISNALTPHPCVDNERCDAEGCGLNPYTEGYHDYYGPGKTVDTSRPFTVTTRFITDDGTTRGTLVNITRIYVQDGVRLPSANPSGDTITADGCTSGKPYGGFEQMGRSLGEGMAMVLCIWNDATQYMNWLDSGVAGTCNSTVGNPDIILANYPTTHVTFSNIRWGDIGSTIDLSVPPVHKHKHC